MKNPEEPKIHHPSIFLKNFVAGLGWMVGATFGFAIFITLLSLTMSWLGGLPVIGNFFAGLIEATNKALETKKSLGR